MRLRLLLTVLVFVGCNKPDKPVATATPEAVPEMSATPSGAASASQAPPSVFPPLEDICTTDADCTVTSLLLTCCGGCALKFSNKTYVAKVTAYCAAHPPGQCPPLGCSWATAVPYCVAGRCQAKI